MVEKDRYLIVVSVLEGRKFPKRAKHKIIAEARFDGELLATDPVDHVENPDFTQELAWELNKKGLHQHRLQRTSIKVQCYAVDPQSSMREAVGYVVLDLRSAANVQTSKWYPLLHTKYQRAKPEIKLGMYIDDDKNAEPQSFKAKEAPPRLGKADEAEGDFNPATLKPVLNDVEGYYQIGPELSCNEDFLLSVTIAFASNLPNLIPSSIPLPDNAFFFYYSLLGNDVTNEAFKDLLNPSFPAERASVKVKSSVEALRLFFANQPGIEVHLCCGDQSLGSCEVPLGSLVKRGSTEIYMKPVTIEGAFSLEPPNKLKQQLPAVPDDMKPVVGVSVVLRKEDLASKESPSRDANSEFHQLQQAMDKMTKSPPKAQAKPPSSGEKAQSKPSHEKDRQPQKVEQPRPKSPTPPPTHDGSYTDTFDTGDQASSVRDEPAAKTQTKQSHPSPVVDDKPRGEPKPGSIHGSPGPVLAMDPIPGGRPVPELQPPSGDQTQHFCLSIDLRSVRDFDVPHSANVFLRYTYAFFGSAAPIFTHPPVEVRKGVEVLLPQSFCAFDFATNPQQLQDTFMRVPLIVEIWDRDKNKSQNTLIGACQLMLSHVLGAEKARAVHSSGANGWRQLWSDRLAILPIEGPAKKIGELYVVLSLEDWGSINMQRVVVNDGSQSQTSEASQPVQKPVEPRETQEYKAALELEMWKEAQEHAFDSQLKEKENLHMRALAEEWKKRDKDREILVKKKIAEYNQLEQQLRKTLGDLEKRDKQLAANEQEVLRLRADLAREHDRKMTEVREASRRMKEDCDHQVQLERAKVKDMEDYVAKIKQQLSEAEAKSHAVDKEFITFKEQQNSKPEVRLQSEINLLTLEKAELERKLDAMTKSKVHYKQQWGRALKELARLKQREQEVARAQLRKQQQELEHMRLRYLASEEKEVVKSDRKELEEIKKELNQLRVQESNRSGGQHDDSGGQMAPLAPDNLDLENDEDHITRLIEERDTLLKTGVYTSEDRIIAELDRQIREAIAKKGR